MKNRFPKFLIISLGLHLAFFTVLALFIRTNSDKIDTFINVDIFQFSQPKVRPRKNIVKTVRSILTHEEADVLNRHNFHNLTDSKAHTLTQTPVATTAVTKSKDESHELIRSGYGLQDILVIPQNRITKATPVSPYKIELNRSNPSQITQGSTPRANGVPSRLPRLYSILTSITLTESRIDPMREFLELIRRKIENVKMYPHWAREAGYEGIAKIQFAISSDGQLGEVSIVDSSEYDILDNAAIAAIEKAAPFPALPESLNRDILRIELPIVFKLNNEYVTQ
ncbi:TPA: energy transducer TonB [Candidatus Poribacteria bacterium]|nr:energy transducer TonB [Candidatus Poribacteria bacterium]